MIFKDLKSILIVRWGGGVAAPQKVNNEFKKSHLKRKAHTSFDFFLLNYLFISMVAIDQTQ